MIADSGSRLQMAPRKPVSLARMNPVQVKKLLLSKWTAVQPAAKDKHFIVTRLLPPDDPAAALEWVEIEAVMSRRVQRIAWRALQDSTVWCRGWR
jgi:tryptophan-rich hypothetical protein